MGSTFRVNFCCINPQASSPRTPTTAGTPPHISASDVGSYLKAFLHDRDLRYLNPHLRRIKSLSAASVRRRRPSSFGNTLKEAIASWIGANQYVLRHIEAYREDIHGNDELRALVEKYLKLSIQTLESFADLDRCVESADDRLRVLQDALLHNGAGGGEDDYETGYEKVRQELRNFEQAGNPFTSFLSSFQSVCTQQENMLRWMAEKEEEIWKDLKKVKVYKKMFKFIFVGIVVTVIVCGAVAAAVSAPHLVVTLTAAAASAPLTSVGSWLVNLWNKYEDCFKRRNGIVSDMRFWMTLLVEDWRSINMPVKKLEEDMESMLNNADVGSTGGDLETDCAIQHIKKKVDGLRYEIEEIVRLTEIYRRNNRETREEVLRLIISLSIYNTL